MLSQERFLTRVCDCSRKLLSLWDASQERPRACVCDWTREDLSLWDAITATRSLDQTVISIIINDKNSDTVNNNFNYDYYGNNYSTFRLRFEQRFSTNSRQALLSVDLLVFCWIFPLVFREWGPQFHLNLSSLPACLVGLKIYTALQSRATFDGCLWFSSSSFPFFF